MVGVVSVPVGVLVGVCVTGVLVRVAVEVGVPVPIVGIEVLVGVFVAVVTARFRKMTIVWDAAYPSTIVTLALRVPGSWLFRRSAGIVYTPVTAYPACASSVTVNPPASTPMSPEHAPVGMVTDLPANRKVK